MTTTYLVTGCAGFIGSGVAKTLLENGHRVVGIDNLSDYYSPHLKRRRLRELFDYPSFYFFMMDLNLSRELISHCSRFQIDAVFHLAAQPGVQFSLESPYQTIKNNVDATLSVLEVCCSRQTSNTLSVASTLFLMV